MIFITIFRYLFTNQIFLISKMTIVYITFTDNHKQQISIYTNICYFVYGNIYTQQYQSFINWQDSQTVLLSNIIPQPIRNDQFSVSSTIIPIYKQIIHQIIQYNNLFIPTQNIIQKMKHPKHLKKAQQWINKHCFPNIKMVGNTVQAISDADIFGIDMIQNKYSFTVSIIKLNYSVGLGLIDSTNKNTKIGIKDDFSNVVCYCNDSLAWNGAQGGFKGRGFHTGDTITVNVNLSEGYIEWVIQDNIVHSIQSAKLMDSSVKWVPYLWLCSNSSAYITI